MKVTIFLPAYNAALYLRDSLDSIMRQAFKDFDVKGAIVCESPSIEGDARILSDYYKSL